MSTKELMLSNCSAGEHSWESLGQQGIKSVSSKGNQPWIFNGRTNTKAEAPILWPPDAKSPTHWKRPWCWEKLRTGRESDERGWDGWMASSTQWTWVSVNSGRQWRTGEPGVLQSMGSQRVGHDLATGQHSKVYIRRTEELLEESERGEWKSWLKTQHSKN